MDYFRYSFAKVIGTLAGIRNVGKIMDYLT